MDRSLRMGVDADYFPIVKLEREEWFQKNKSNSAVKWLPIIENDSGRTTARFYIPMLRKCISVDGRIFQTDQPEYPERGVY